MSSSWIPCALALLIGCQAPPGGPETAAGKTDPASAGRTEGDTIETRFAPPPGYTRLPLPQHSFGGWLRGRPLYPGRSQVRLFDGRRKGNQQAHIAVLEIDVGDRDLQQCADAVIRLRAEYLFDSACSEEIRFDFTSGDTAEWSDWQSGMRPQVQGDRVRWRQTAEHDAGYDNFRRYLDVVFTYAGSASLERELSPVGDPTRVEVGDVFIQGGFPGHAVIVIDAAANAAGERIFLLAQSFMPAQQIHVLRGPEPFDPWYPARPAGALSTPEWDFDHADLRRFEPSACER